MVGLVGRVVRRSRLALVEDGGGGGRAGVGGRAGGEGSVVSLSGLPDWRLCERVTLDDMRF